MKYNLNNSLECNQFLERAKYLSQRADCVVELTEKKPKSLNQNSYAHVAIAYFASQIGETEEYCKRQYFKIECNPDLFIREKEDRIFKEKRKYLRSFADLTKEETTLAIDRFLIWASQNAGIYIPSVEDYHQVQQMELEIERAHRFL